MHTDTVYDLAIIGGGVNGCGIANDASQRGLNVFLCEQHDLASGTSSASTKLIHGGLRYLEQFEFRLVRKALKEREILLNNAPHIIQPLDFVLPHAKHLRPIWIIRLGLFLYDHLAKHRKLVNSKFLKLANTLYGKPLQSQYRNGFRYADCWVDDARLVVLNAIAARENGAIIATRHKVIKVDKHPTHWLLTIQNQLTHHHYTIKAKVLINASGPWVNQVNDSIIKQPAAHHTLLSQGSHIIVKKCFAGEHAYIFQNHDQRIVFAIPYENNFTLIGTTDNNYIGDPSNATVSSHEVDYLLESVNHYFNFSLNSNDVLHTYTGVRPLLLQKNKSLSEVTRDYSLDLSPDTPALLTIYGGKITTYRILAEEVLTKLKKIFPKLAAGKTAKTALPGGDFENLTHFIKSVTQQYPWLPASLCQHYVKTFGTRTHRVLKNCQSLNDLGIHFGQNVYQKEIDYYCQHEWAQTSEDILWRRSKLGLHCNAKTIANIQDYLIR